MVEYLNELKIRLDLEIYVLFFSHQAGLLAIAVTGLVMIHSFNGRLDDRLDQIAVPPEAQRTLDSEQIKLAAIEIPARLPEETREAVKMAIDESFVFGFRRVMFGASALAFMSALLARLLIRDR